MHNSTALSLFVLLGFATFAPQVGAQVFKCKQSSGLTVYSDKPCEFAPQTTDVRLVTKPEDTSQFNKAAGVDQKGAVQTSGATADAAATSGSAGTVATVGNARTLLRALGPDQALDSQGKVYKRTGGGYIDGQGTFIPGVARGHR